MSAARQPFAASLLTSLQPIGIAIAQILSFCAANVGEVAFSDAVPALTVAGVVTLMLWLLGWGACGGARPGAFVASLVAFCFWAAMPLGTLLGGSDAERADLVSRVIVFASPVLVAATVIWLRRTSRSPSGLYRVVDAVSFFGVAVPLFTLLTAAGPAAAPPLEGGSVPDGAQAATQKRVSDRLAGSLPDIYLIVLDAYGRDDELAGHFGITRGLGARLEERGFYVAKESRANYTTTLHALPALLNYELIQDLLNRKERTHRRLTELVQDSRFARELAGLGYRIISYETGVELSELRGADEYIQPPPPLRVPGLEFQPSYFERGLLELTAAGPFLRRSSSLSPYTLHRGRILHALRDTPRHARAPEPTFVFAHVLSPHEPFVFGRHGQDVSPRHRRYDLSDIYPDPDQPEEPGRVGPEYARRYADQAQYIADLVVECVDAILERSPEPPIIVVQGDHGPYGFSPNVRSPRRAILNAHYLPGSGAARLYPSISPINTPRVILDEYFDAGLPLLEDQYFDSSWATPKRFTEVE